MYPKLHKSTHRPTATHHPLASILRTMVRFQAFWKSVNKCNHTASNCIFSSGQHFVWCLSIFLVGFSVTYVGGRWNWLSTWQLVGWQKSFRCNFSCSCISSWTSWQMLCSIIDAHWKFQGRVPKVLELITLLNATLYVALPWKIYQYFWWCS